MRVWRGVISTHFSRPGHPSERQLRLTNILARQAADYLERKHSEQVQQIILRELQHRSNNLLAVIQSIAQRSLAGSHWKKAFEARLQALARANRALLKSNWGGVDLTQLVRSEMEACEDAASSAVSAADDIGSRSSEWSRNLQYGPNAIRRLSIRSSSCGRW